MLYLIHSSLSHHMKQKGTAKWNDDGHWSLGGHPEMPIVHRTGSWLGWCWSVVGQGLMRLLITTKNGNKKQFHFPNPEHRVSLKLRLSKGQLDGSVGHGACYASLKTWVQSLTLIKRWKSRRPIPQYCSLTSTHMLYAIVPVSTYSILPLLNPCFLILL